MPMKITVAPEKKTRKLQTETQDYLITLLCFMSFSGETVCFEGVTEFILLQKSKIFDYSEAADCLSCISSKVVLNHIAAP